MGSGPPHRGSAPGRQARLGRRRTLRRLTPLARRTPPPRTLISPASEAQRAKVAHQPCLVCGRRPVDPAHLVPRSLGGCDHRLRGAALPAMSPSLRPRRARPASLPRAALSGRAGAWAAAPRAPAAARARDERALEYRRWGRGVKLGGLRHRGGSGLASQPWRSGSRLAAGRGPPRGASPPAPAVGHPAAGGTDQGGLGPPDGRAAHARRADPRPRRHRARGRGPRGPPGPGRTAPAPSARVLALKLAGFSYREIMELLGVTYTNVNRQQSEGRAELRRVA
jgi:hypothetical protein